MQSRTALPLGRKQLFGNLISCGFGVLFVAIGAVNMFWGNDPGFGAFIVLLALVYFPPVTSIIKKVTGFSIPLLVKILVGLFILWAALGVGELFDKVDLMVKDLS